jgi:hypothetical protein
MGFRFPTVQTQLASELQDKTLAERAAHGH